jgi:predicted acyltransferase
MKAEASAGAGRVTSIDAARGLVMFTMIFVNDIAGVSHNVVPDWMRHFHGKSGMTFVDLVFPAFLFIVGMSIPFALGPRLQAGESLAKTGSHIVTRTLSLLLIGVMMVNDESPGASMSGLSPGLWSVLMYLSAICAFCSIASRPVLSRVLRWAGLVALAVLALMFQGDKGQRIIAFAPFSFHPSWYGILGLIAWAYLVGAAVYLVFRGNSVALLGCMVLLLCLYPADRAGLFDGLWIRRYIGIDTMIGAHPSITVAGLILASILTRPNEIGLTRVLRFTGWFVLACAAVAVLLNGLYGVNKNAATPSWCLWACATTALVWLMFHILQFHSVTRIFALAGCNVLLAYLLSEMMPAFLSLTGLDDYYDRFGNLSLAAAMARSAGLGALLLAATVGLNKLGFRLRL